MAMASRRATGDRHPLRRSQARLGVALGIASILLGSCIVGSPAPSASKTAISLRVIDTVTKPSVETDHIVFGILLEGSGGPLQRPLDGVASWAGSGPSSLCWMAAQGSKGETAFPYTSEHPCALVEPTLRGEFCAAAYDAPAAKELDGAHPDAVQPALTGDWYMSGVPFKGWVSWQVVTRSDCEAHFNLNATTFSGKVSQIGEWTQVGPDAEKVGATHLFDMHLAGGDQAETTEFTVPDSGQLVIRAQNDGTGCDLGVAFLQWNEIKPPVVQPQYELSLATGQVATELALDQAALSPEPHVAYVTGCSGATLSLIRRGPPY